MVIFAGSGTNSNGAWELSLAGTPTWSDLTPPGAPHATLDGANFGALYDPILDRVILVGGDGSGKASVLAFKKNPPPWTQVYPGGASLGTRFGPSVIYEPDQGLAVVFGGRSEGPYYDSTMRLDLGGGFFVDAGGANGFVTVDQWCHQAGQTATLVPTPNSGYMFNQWFGDASGSSNPLQVTMDSYKVIEAEFVVPPTTVEETPVAFAFAVRPNPSRGPVEIEYALPRESQVRLSVFDVAGREVARLVDGPRSAAVHVASWSGIGARARARAGVYLVRLETPEGTWVRRLALLR